MKHYIILRRAKYFACLDHDIFPLEKYSFLQHIGDQDFYGLLQERGERWYLWPGFCVFKLKATLNKKMNFLPIRGLDTGGGNYPELYSRCSKSRLRFCAHGYRSISMGDCGEETCVETADSWLHVFTMSNWNQSSGNKQKWDVISREILQPLANSE